MCQNYDTFNAVIKQAIHASNKAFGTQHKQHQIVAQFEEAFHFIIRAVKKISFFSFFRCRNRPTTHASHQIQWVKYRRVCTSMWLIVEASNYVRMRHCLVLIGELVLLAHPFWLSAQNAMRVSHSAYASSEISASHFGSCRISPDV